MTQASAGFRNKTADKIPNADHHQVCKYENSLSQGFEMVITRLEILQRDLKSRLGMHSREALRGDNLLPEAAEGVVAQQKSKDGTNNT